MQHEEAGDFLVNWALTAVAPDGTHHTAGGLSLYEERFDEVLPFHAPGLAPVRRDHLAWHIDEGGRAAYARRFEQTFGFYGGLAAAVSGGRWHHVLPDGTDGYPERNAWCGNFQEGLCVVRDAVGNYFHIDATGAIRYGQRWRYAGDYREGYAVVQAESGALSHIDPSGDLLHARWFDDLDVFHKGAARARDGNGWMHVNRRGVPLYERRFAMVEPFYNGQARVERLDGGREVIDPGGICLVELRSTQT